LHAPNSTAESNFIYTDLYDLSNQVPDLIKQEKYDEAGEVCRNLRSISKIRLNNLRVWKKRSSLSCNVSSKSPV